MTVRWSCTIAIASVLLLGPGTGGAQQGEPVAPGDGTLVLRGSGMPPRPAPAPTMDPARWQVAAGEELWLVDPAAGIAVACALRNTSKVGVRVIRCETDDLPRVVTD